MTRYHGQSMNPPSFAASTTASSGDAVMHGVLNDGMRNLRGKLNWLLAIIVAALALCQQNAHAQLTYVGHWECQDDTNNTVVDAAVGTDAGVAETSSNTDAISEDVGPGSELPKSFHLNGAGLAIALPDLDASLADDASFCMWVKLDDAVPDTSATTGFVILGVGDNDRTHYPWTDGDGYMSVWRGVDGSSNSRIDAITLPGVDRTTWHHVAVTTTPGSNGWKLYVNGDLVTQTTGLTSQYLASGNWFVGRSVSSGGTVDLDGYICDIRIDDVAWSEGQIEDIIAEADAGGGGVVSPIDTTIPGAVGVDSLTGNIPGTP